MENRAYRRYRVWLPVRVEADALEVALAVSRDASEGGLLLSATGAMQVGARVELAFTLPTSGTSGEERRASGTIVRVEPNPDDPEGAWPHRVAVRFDAPIEGLEAALAKMQEDLARAE